MPIKSTTSISDNEHIEKDVIDRLLSNNLTRRRRLFLRLAANRSLALLSLLGLLVGALVGLLMVGFEALITYSHTIVTSGGTVRPDDFSTMPPLNRLLAPIGGGLFIALVFVWARAEERFSGIAHVINQLSHHDSMLPSRNALFQFGGACVALASGMSVGREGPAIHIGAALAGYGGRRGLLPANATRILVACGTAAAVAASFNTPLAGVILAMEVILMEYSIAGFAPIILASVGATAVAHVFHGTLPTFAVPDIGLASLTELPWLVVVGIALGCLSRALGTMIDIMTAAVVNWSLYAKLTFAGVVCGGFGFFVPEVMGVGYTTVDKTLLGEYALGFTVLLLVLKLLASSAAIAMGVPGGIIGPTIVTGALAGAVLGYIGQSFGLDNVSPIAFYALLGMGAMMGATLHAPLAALTAMLELSSNPNVILPGMLVVIVAYLTNRVGFNGQSIFLRILERQGEPWVPDPREQAMQQTSVATTLDDDAIALEPTVLVADLAKAASEHQWVVVPQTNSLYSGADLLEWQQQNLPDFSDNARIEIGASGVRNKHCLPISTGASVYSAYLQLSRGETQSFYVVWPTEFNQASRSEILGILGEDAVRGYVKLEYCRL
ncbi:MAG: CIC family chloride channel protein [Gammaproteobacteria bacterium]|jgi:CIC family chloride channel protein